MWMIHKFSVLLRSPYVPLIKFQSWSYFWSKTTFWVSNKQTQDLFKIQANIAKKQKSYSLTSYYSAKKLSVIIHIQTYDLLFNSHELSLDILWWLFLEFKYLIIKSIFRFAFV